MILMIPPNLAFPCASGERNSRRGVFDAARERPIRLPRRAGRGGVLHDRHVLAEFSCAIGTMQELETVQELENVQELETVQEQMARNPRKPCP